MTKACNCGRFPRERSARARRSRACVACDACDARGLAAAACWGSGPVGERRGVAIAPRDGQAAMRARVARRAPATFGCGLRESCDELAKHNFRNLISSFRILRAHQAIYEARFSAHASSSEKRYWTRTVGRFSIPESLAPPHVRARPRGTVAKSPFYSKKVVENQIWPS